MLLWLALKGGILHYFAKEATYLEMNLLVINVHFFCIIIFNLPPIKWKGKLKGIIIEKTFHSKIVTEKRNKIES